MDQNKKKAKSHCPRLCPRQSHSGWRPLHEQIIAIFCNKLAILLLLKCLLQRWGPSLQRLAINSCRQASIRRCVKIVIKWEYNGVSLLSAYHWTNWQLHVIYDSTAINYDKSLKITNLQLSAYRDIYINNVHSESSHKFVYLKQKFRNFYINVQVVAARW